jgi:hypothetical protein
LGQKQRIAHLALRGLRKCRKIGLRGSAPDERSWLEVEGHASLYVSFHIISQVGDPARDIIPAGKLKALVADRTSFEPSSRPVPSTSEALPSLRGAKATKQSTWTLLF